MGLRNLCALVAFIVMQGLAMAGPEMLAVSDSGSLLDERSNAQGPARTHAVTTPGYECNAQEQIADLYLNRDLKQLQTLHPRVETVNLHVQWDADLKIGPWLRALEEFKNLQNLSISFTPDSDITPRGVLSLSHGLRNLNLRGLNLGGLTFDQSSAGMLAEVLGAKTALQSLRVTGSKNLGSFLNLFFGAFENMESLSTVDFGFNNLCAHDLSILVQGLAGVTSLKEVAFFENKGHFTSQSLKKLLEKNTIYDLRFAFGKFDRDFVKTLLDLPRDNSLKFLKLVYPSIPAELNDLTEKMDQSPLQRFEADYYTNEKLWGFIPYDKHHKIRWNRAEN